MSEQIFHTSKLTVAVVDLTLDVENIWTDDIVTACDASARRGIVQEVFHSDTVVVLIHSGKRQRESVSVGG